MRHYIKCVMYVSKYTRKTKKKNYDSYFICEAYRNEEGKPRQRRLLNISHLPIGKIEAIKAALKGGNIVDWDTLPGLSAKSFGLSYAVVETLKKIGLFDAIGSEGTHLFPTIAAMIANRIDEPCSKYSLKNWIKGSALPEILEQKGENWYHENKCYAALDWIAKNQVRLENKLYEFREKPQLTFLYDLTSTYFEGDKAELAEYGYSRDHRKDLKQVCIGLLGDMDGIPCAVEAFPGNTSDCMTVKSQLDKMRDRFGCEKAIFVGDRGMVTKANRDELDENGFDFILALKNREVIKLVEKHGPKTMGLFDKRGIAEVEVDDRRLIVCHNPIAGADTRKRRKKLLAKTEEKLNAIIKRVENGRLKKPVAIQRAIDRWLDNWAMGKFFTIEVDEGNFVWSYNDEVLNMAKKLDGVYVIETSLEKEQISTEKVQRVYKNLQQIERAFRCLKSEIKLRPVRHWKADRIKGHIYICVLAYHVEQVWRNALKRNSGDQKFEWNEALALLRNWQRISVIDSNRLSPKDSNFNLQTAKLMQILEINLP